MPLRLSEDLYDPEQMAADIAGAMVYLNGRCINALAVSQGVAAKTAAFLRLRQVHDILEAAFKEVHGALDVATKTTLPEAMDAEDVPSITVNGFRVSRTSRMSVTVAKDVRPQAHEWLRANELGDIIQETVSATTLSGVAAALAEDNRELPDALFRVFTQPSVSVTKVKRST